MSAFVRLIPLSLSLAAFAMQANAQPPTLLKNSVGGEAAERYNCPSDAVHNLGSLPSFPETSVNEDHVFLNARVPATREFWYAPPKEKVFVLTDIIVQNKASGDDPVQDGQFSRVAITSPTGSDTFFSLLGNRTLSEHFQTGLVIPSAFRFYNMTNSSAPFVEVLITGVLRDCTRKH